ncbi:MAG: hypothetical protein K2W97_02550 [Chthoniobacterales bacterium]|nr:hypothetical protein [Chthoniobacterales bacterium]
MTTLLNEKTKPLSKKENKKETVNQRSYQEVLEKLEAEASLVGEEPPTWHESVLKEREGELRNCKVLGQNLEEAIKELKAELDI